MRRVRTIHVRPCLPDRLLQLEELAYNLRWSWDHDTIALFRRLDHDLWEETGHNPVLLLGNIPQCRLDEAARDEAFLAHMDRVADDLRDYTTATGTWYRKNYGPRVDPVVAYFSMEFGITECLPIYSGGLGILAGDHLKSASDLGIPLVGVGLLYQKGYFRQRLTSLGLQQEFYPENDFSVMPVRPVPGERGGPLRVEVPLDGRTVLAQAWRVQVGRVTLVLLDTNIPENPQDLQDITDELYGGDGENRIRQEILLSVGGVRALAAMGLAPRVYHMNEGHCAFLGLERARVLMREHGLGFRDALEVVASSSVFTTHTPVPAGIDTFRPELVERHLEPLRHELGLTRQELLDLGRLHPGSAEAPFNTAVLAIRTSGFVNGVSRLHGEVSREMWKDLWPKVPLEEIPIGHITNGVHPQTWISEDMRRLYDRYLGPRWAEEPGDTRVWKRTEQIPGEELWRTHERRRERLVAFARQRFAEQLRNSGASHSEISRAEEILSADALTIGFARRFATYKRATLLLSDPERLAKLLNAPGRPVQILFAGKAHPKDEPGKELIRQIVQLARRPEFRRHIVFLEDYDQVVARYLVQGADVWLNTPQRPMEASGTSGMKAAFNGALNLSILDGWWDEAWSPRTGWAIGQVQNTDRQDDLDAEDLYEVLEQEVVPLFYDRGADGLPRGWVSLMRSAVGEVCPVFNTNRMVHQYTTTAYAPAEQRRASLEADDFRRARALCAWKQKVRQAWPEIHVARVELDLPEHARVGNEIEVRAWVHTGSLSAEDLSPQVQSGRLRPDRGIIEPVTTFMVSEGRSTDDTALFKARIPCLASGTIGLTVRVLPSHADLARMHETALIVWDGERVPHEAHG